MIGPNSLAVSEALVREPQPNSFVINIGSHDGKSFDDPCYPLYQRGFPGIAIDGAKHPAIYQNLPNDKVVKLMGQFVTPSNVTGLLRDHRCPDEPHMLKIDVDGIDSDILASILLGGIRPDFFQIEIQPEFPPPIVFAVKYHPLFGSKTGFGGFYGASISAIEVISRAFGYTLISMDLTTKGTHDVLYARNDLLECGGFTALDVKFAYEQEGCQHYHFNQCSIASQRWQRRTDFNNLIGEMFQACVYASQARFGVVLPFELGVDWTCV